ncbi:MAG TPA: hypothetical protein VLN26_17925 [Gaiellaceae bacterium]|nr:hypothetical protein [Gaiellaceae bacterium]
MQPSALIRCADGPCADVVRGRFAVPEIELDPDAVRIVLIAEAAPSRSADWYFAGADALYAQTTVQAFRDAGEVVASIRDVLDLGVYPTTAVKCGKTGHGLSKQTVEACSVLLELELGLFPFARALLLMGDAAIKAVNAIARRNGEPRVVPAGATYRLRGGDYRFRGIKAFPSYVQAGPAFLNEKAKRRMIAEDIASALAFVRAGARP